MVKFAVTGGAGFLGAYLTNFLASLPNCKVAVLDNLLSGKMENLLNKEGTVEFVSGDIRDPIVVDTIMNNTDVCIHLAGITFIPKTAEEVMKCYNVALNGLLTVLDSARKFNVKKFIFGSSHVVYGSLAKKIRSETDVPFPNNAYGYSKLIGEWICHEFVARTDLNITCLRFFSVYGPKESINKKGASVVTHFITKALNNEKFPVYGSLSASRDFIYISDAIQAIVCAIRKNEKFNVYNVGSGKSVSIEELINLINSELGKKIGYTIMPSQNDLEHSEADIKKIKEIGYMPKVSFEEGIRSTLEWNEDEFTAKVTDPSNLLKLK